MKRTLLLLILAIVVFSASGCKRKKQSCAAYDTIEVIDRRP